MNVNSEISYVHKVDTFPPTHEPSCFHTTIHTTRVESSAARRSAPPVPNYLPGTRYSRARALVFGVGTKALVHLAPQGCHVVILSHIRI
jgi:hypothetical protein